MGNCSSVPKSKKYSRKLNSQVWGIHSGRQSPALRSCKCYKSPSYGGAGRQARRVQRPCFDETCGKSKIRIAIETMHKSFPGIKLFTFDTTKDKVKIVNVDTKEVVFTFEIECNNVWVFLSWMFACSYKLLVFCQCMDPARMIEYSPLEHCNEPLNCHVCLDCRVAQVAH